MSLAELAANRFPRYRKGSLRRSIKLTSAQTRKSVRRTTRQTVHAIATWQRNQYYLATAFRDLRVAISRNEDIVLGVLIIAAIVAFAFANTAANLIFVAFQSAWFLNIASGLSMVPLIALVSGILATLAAWLTAWFSNALTFAVVDGANRKRRTSLRQTIRRGLRLASRTAASWLMLVMLVGAPLAILGVISVAFVGSFTDQSLEAFLQTILVTGSVGALWVLYAMTSYSLAPHVAIFEPEVPLSATFNRSRKLLSRRGRPFVLALYLTAAATIYASYLLAHVLDSRIGKSADAIFYLGTFMTLLSTNAMKSILYRKRKLARIN